MAEAPTLHVSVTTNLRETLARELREAADKLDPRPPFETAEDLRGAQAEIDRLTHLLGSHADGHRCTCTMTKPADYHPDSMTPAEWEPDPWCPTHPDMDYILAYVVHLRAFIRGEGADADVMVEKIARVLHGLGHPDGCYCDALGWEAWASDARAVLAALAGPDA